MKKVFAPILLLMVVTLTAWANIPNGYYNKAVGKKDAALVSALEDIVRPHTELSYQQLWVSFDSTDVGSDGYYIDMYSNCKYNNQSAHPAGASYVGEGLNREHSFPKSWFNSQTPTYTDLHMLLPVDAFVNQRRSNHPYGVCAIGTTYTNGDLTMLGKIGTSTYNGYSETVYEPDDEYKGDLARIYFYVVTCYNSDVSTWSSGQLDYASNGYKAFSNWSIQMLMEWHRADPVSAKEISRNEGVFGEQGNRNPFVDHPELAEYIWGTKQNTTWTGIDIPDDPILKKVPQMLAVDTTAVTGKSFRANWTNAGDVSSYYLKVNRIAVPGDETASLLMTENFSKVTATSDNNKDIGSSLDNYTDNKGWTGYKVFDAAGQSIKVGTASVVGYLKTPELDLGSTVTVVFKAKNWIASNGTSDGSSVVVKCGDVSDVVTLSDVAADYTVVLHGCTEKKVELTMTAIKKRFYVYNVSVYNGDLTARTNGPRRVIEEFGDSTWRNVSGITDTCYTVDSLAGGVYEYMVKAIYTDGDESVWSNIQHVTIVASDDNDDLLLGDVNGDHEVDINDVTTLINYVLGYPTSPFDADAADYNKDKEININDITALIHFLLTGQNN